MSSARRTTPAFRLTVTAEAGRPFVPFLRTNLRKAHALLTSPPTGSKTRAKSLVPLVPKDVRAAAAALTECSLVLVGDRRMSELHAQFMGIAGPTDVLTFPIDEDARGRVTSGEVYVCVPEARRQARARKIPHRLELLLYSVHGMLHLVGYDDRTDREFARMHETEDALLTGLGFGPVFAAPPGAPAGAGAGSKAGGTSRRAASAPGRRGGRNRRGTSARDGI